MSVHLVIPLALKLCLGAGPKAVHGAFKTIGFMWMGQVACNLCPGVGWACPEIRLDENNQSRCIELPRLVDGASGHGGVLTAPYGIAGGLRIVGEICFAVGTVMGRYHFRRRVVALGYLIMV